MQILNYLLTKAKEASTWRGIALLLAACGVTIAPELLNTIITISGGVVGMIEVVRSDSNVSSEQTKIL